MASVLALAATIVGLPWLFLSIGASPKPDHLPAWDEISAALSRRDDGTLLLAFITDLAWAMWLAWTWLVVREAAAQVRRRPVPQVPGLGGPQQLAALLISGLGAMLIGTTVSMTRASAVPAPQPSVAASAPPPQTAGSPLVPGKARPAPPQRLARMFPAMPEQTPAPPASRQHHTVRFAFDTADLPPAARSALAHLAEDIRQHADPAHPITVVGHTDSLGPATYNQHLSVRRARAVRRALGHLSSHGFHFDVAGRGEEDPIARETHPDGTDAPDARAQNRRVEITYVLAGASRPPGPAAARSPRSHAADAPVRPPSLAPPRTPPASASPGNRAAQSAPAPHHAVHQQTDDQHGRLPITQAAEYSALLAAGVLSLLGGKRLIQQRRRRPGERIRMPEPASDLEQQMRRHQEPASVELLDRALRSLAASAAKQGGQLPDLTGARVTATDVELLLDKPAAPITPFGSAGNQRWRLNHDAPELLDSAAVPDIPAPYPALVTIGHDTDGAHILVDLETIGAVGLSGGQPHVEEVLTAIALELATCAWADHLVITCVGFAPELPRTLGNGRLHHTDTIGEALAALEARARDIDDVLSESDVESVRTARTRQVASDAWTPEILLSAVPLSQEEYTRLSDLVLAEPTTSLAAVIAATGEQSLPGVCQLDTTPGTSTNIDSANTRVTLQRVTSDQYRQLLTDLATANDTTGVPATDWPDVPAEHEQTPPPLDRTAPPTESIAIAFEPPVGDHAADTSTPEIRVLGRVEITNRDPADVESGKRNLLVELAAYLKLHTGCTAEEVSRAMGGPRGPWSPSTRASNMSRLRAWLGRDPDGHNYVPALGEGQLYTISTGVDCDWHQFTEISKRGLARGADGLDDLRAALALVRGQPFSGSTPARYIWAEHLKQEMISAIVDVTHTLAVHLIDQGAPAEARTVIAKGLEVEPVSELLYRDLFRAEHRAGNINGITNASQRLIITLDQLDLEMEPETADLLNELTNTTARPSSK